jgi:putative component of membrane protein insertase Oxa1/YidC/SpoIIIJ protein YidD
MRLNCVIAATCAILTAGILFADERTSLAFINSLNPIAEPVETASPRANSEPLNFTTSELSLAGTSLLRFYQVFISTQDIPSCPFEPTDSQFARLAISQYGFVLGIIMASDRYQRCNGFGFWYYRRTAGGRLIDPVENELP